MWGNAVRVGGTCKHPVRLSIQDGPMKTVEYMWVSIQCMLIAPAKILECEGMDGCISPCCHGQSLSDLHEKCDSIA